MSALWSLGQLQPSGLLPSAPSPASGNVPGGRNREKSRGDNCHVKLWHEWRNPLHVRGLGKGGGSWQGGQLLRGNHRGLTKHLEDSTHTSQICLRWLQNPCPDRVAACPWGEKKKKKKRRKRKKTKPQPTIHGADRGLQVLCFHETPQASRYCWPGIWAMLAVHEATRSLRSH